MSIFADDSRPGTPASRDGDDPAFLDDEERIPSILKGLIDQQKLQGAWSKVGKRLRTAEANLLQVQQRLDRLPVEFVQRPAYQDLVETQHAAQLAAHAKALERLDELTARLSSAVFEEHHYKLQDSLARLKSQEDVFKRIDREANENNKMVKDFKETFVTRLGQADYKFQESQRQNSTELTTLQTQMEESVNKLWDDLRSCEDRMKLDTAGKVDEAVKAALSFDEGGAQDQKKLLDMIDRELVDVVRKEQTKTFEKVVKLGTDVDQQRNDLVRQIRVVETKASTAADGLSQHKKDMHQDLEKRPFTKDILALEQSIRSDVTALTGICEGLQTKTVIKLNEFVDHVGKLHETIDDHEHCLRHHAEEMENRSTKYDLLLCQSQIDKCVSQEQYGDELQDLKKVVSWQTNKIENFGLGAPMGSGAKGKPQFSKKGRQSTSFQRKSSGMSPQHSLVSTPEDRDAQVNTERSLPEFPDANVDATNDEGETEGVPESPEKATYIFADDDVASPQGTSPAAGARSRSPVSFDPPEMMEPEMHRPPSNLERPDNEDRPASGRVSVMSGTTSSMLSHQVEALAMALVSVAHLVLVPPKLGLSSHAKTTQKEALIEELGNLRHWVTHKNMPAGWDPSKLTTMALGFAHEAPAPRGPSPEKKEKRVIKEKADRDSLIALSSDDDSAQMKSLMRKSMGQLHSSSEGVAKGVIPRSLVANNAASTSRTVQSARERGKAKPLFGSGDGTLPPLAASGPSKLMSAR